MTMISEVIKSEERDTLDEDSNLQSPPSYEDEDDDLDVGSIVFPSLDEDEEYD
jgi:hypothetical protein